MQTERSSCAAVRLGLKIYAIGGKDRPNLRSCLSSIEVFRVSPEPTRIYGSFDESPSHQTSVSSTRSPNLLEAMKESQAALQQRSQIPNPDLVPVAAEIVPMEVIPFEGTNVSILSNNSFPETSFPKSSIVQAKGTFISQASVVSVESAAISMPSVTASLVQRLSNATSDQISLWLARHGVSDSSLEILD
eukprot:5931782-Ditylum_brightwellii.AAC.1